MMDRSTERELQKITESIPRELMRHILKRDPRDRDGEGIARTIIRKKLGPKALQDEMRRQLESGEFEGKRDRVNEAIQKQLDLYMNTKIEQAFRDGKIRSATKDSFMNRILGQAAPT